MSNLERKEDEKYPITLYKIVSGATKLFWSKPTFIFAGKPAPYTMADAASDAIKELNLDPIDLLSTLTRETKLAPDDIDALRDLDTDVTWEEFITTICEYIVRDEMELRDEKEIKKENDRRHNLYEK